jgi:hypothetical protein
LRGDFQGSAARQRLLALAAELDRTLPAVWVDSPALRISSVPPEEPGLAVQ